MSQYTIFNIKGSFLSVFLHPRPLSGQKLKSQGQGSGKISLRQFKGNPPFFYQPKTLIGSNQRWTSNLKKIATREVHFFWKNLIFSEKMQNFHKYFFLKISTLNIKIWVEGCSLVYSDPLKVFPLSHSGFGNFHFFSDPKIGQNQKFAQNPPKHAQNFFPPRTPLDTCRRSLFYRKKLKTQNHMVNHGLSGNGTNC